MGELIEGPLVCGCLIRNGRYSEVCKADKNRGIKAGQAYV